MKSLLVAVVLIVCAHVQAFDVRRLRYTNSQSQANHAKEIIRLRTPENGYESVQAKISGGFTATPGQIPFQVYTVSDEHYFCAGVIIHPSYVLTLADCAAGGKQFTIYAGSINKNGNDSNQVIVQSVEPIIHEEYYSNSVSNDIALLKLSQQLHFNEYISPALLPSNDYTYVNESAWISGWGASYVGGSGADVLQYAPVTVISNDECSSLHGSDIADDIICTRSDSGEGVCPGDSGGPLYTDFNRGGPNLLIGLILFWNQEGCGIGPDGYTRVSYHRDWILSHVN